MTWFAAGAIAISTATSIYGANASANSQAAAAGRASAAEGKAIARERLNKTISNAYSAAFSQMQLAQQKGQLAQQSSDISAAGVAAQGNVELMAAATGSEGASVQAVSADVAQKVNTAQDQVQQGLEQAVDNYNRSLDMMVINTEQTQQEIRQYSYDGPSAGSQIATGVLGGLAQFAGVYASRQMQLGLGNKPSYNLSSTGGTAQARSALLGGL